MVKDDDTTHGTFMLGDGERKESFLAAYGSRDEDFVFGLLRQLLNIGSKSLYPDEQTIQFALAAVRGIAPRDTTEAMIAAQMVASHLETMNSAKRLAHAEDSTEIMNEERKFNKLSRTFCALIEALSRGRNGDRKVTVHHVSGAEDTRPTITTEGISNGPTSQAPAFKIVHSANGSAPRSSPKNRVNGHSSS